jgi:diguanylate cyclase (GGDEF)-like protein
MRNDLPPEALAELKALFFKELAIGVPTAREALATLAREPDNRPALVLLRGFFHRLAGDGASAQFELLAHLAAACEAASDTALEAGAVPSRTLRIFSGGLDGVDSVLQSSGSDGGPTAEPSAGWNLFPGSGASGGQSPARIAIIEDDPYSAKLIETCLGIGGYRSDWYQDPEKALASIEAATPDLVLLDVQMPKVSGFEICQRIRAHPELQLLPVIFVTVWQDVDQRIRGLEVGANDYIVKPFDPRELVARVASHLQRLSALRDMATRDGLTRCYNHKYFKSRLEQEIARKRRHGVQLSVAILDVDHFKNVNDSHGHLAGDVVLATLGGLVSASVRSIDLVARYGGEEFGLLFVESGANEAAIITNRIRDHVAKHAFALPDAVNPGHVEPVRLTVSLGMTECQKADTVESILSRADEALYAAKSSGRNCVRSA